jgi:integrase
VAKNNQLQDIQVKQAKPTEKTYYLFDGLGLYLEITPNNCKNWKFRYTHNGKRKKTSFQSYPRVSLKQAREKRDNYNELLFNGIDPIEHYKEQKEIKQIEDTSSFKNIFIQWLEMEKSKSGLAQYQWKKTRIENDILPFIGNKKIKDIKIQDITNILIEKNKKAPVTASKLFGYLKSIYSYAKTKGYIEVSLLSDINKSHIISKSKPVHYAKVTDTQNLKDLINNIYNYQGFYSVKNALKFVLHIPLRASNLCNLQWSNINFEDKILTIPRNEMKIKDKNFDDFRMPLSDEVINILNEQKSHTGYQKFIFLGTNNRTPINVESPNKALKIMGFDDEAKGRKITLHGFRGTFRSLMDTLDIDSNFSFETKERALDHHEKSKVVRAYTHKSDFINQLSSLMNFWSDYIKNLIEVK